METTAIEVIASVVIVPVTVVEVVGRLATCLASVVLVIGRLPTLPASSVEPTGRLAVSPVTVVEVTGRLAMHPAPDVAVICTLATTAPPAGLCGDIHHRDSKDGPVRMPVGKICFRRRELSVCLSQSPCQLRVLREDLSRYSASE